MAEDKLMRLRNKQGCDRLAEATIRLYQRTADKHRVSLDEGALIARYGVDIVQAWRARVGIAA